MRVSFVGVLFLFDWWFLLFVVFVGLCVLSLFFGLTSFVLVV